MSNIYSQIICFRINLRPVRNQTHQYNNGMPNEKIIDS